MKREQALAVADPPEAAADWIARLDPQDASAPAFNAFRTDRSLQWMAEQLSAWMHGMLEAADRALMSDSGSAPRVYVEKVSEATAALIEVMNELLELLELESGEAEFAQETFDPRAILIETFKPWQRAAWREGVKLVADLSPDLPSAIRGDSTWFRRVMTTLVIEAIKRTNRPWFVLQVASQRTAADEVQLHFSICHVKPLSKTEASDDGGGSKSMVPLVQVVAALEWAVFCRLVEFLGGRQWVEEAADLGAIQHLTLPFRMEENDGRMADG